MYSALSSCVFIFWYLISHLHCVWSDGVFEARRLDTVLFSETKFGKRWFNCNMKELIDGHWVRATELCDGNSRICATSRRAVCHGFVLFVRYVWFFSTSNSYLLSGVLCMVTFSLAVMGLNHTHTGTETASSGTLLQCVSHLMTPVCA